MTNARGAAVLALLVGGACGDNLRAPASGETAVDAAGAAIDAAPDATGPGCVMAPDRALIGIGVAPSVLPVAGGYQMIYAGVSFQTGILFTSTSTDGVTWTDAVEDTSRKGYFIDQAAYPDGHRAIFYNLENTPPDDEQNNLWMATATGDGPWSDGVRILAHGAPGDWDAASIQQPTAVYAQAGTGSGTWATS